MIRFTYKKLILLFLITSSILLIQNCNINELIDCVGELNADEFHFIGTHDISGSVLITKIPVDTAYNGEIPHDSASIVFKEDGSFTMKVNIKHDTSWVFHESIWEYLNLSGNSEELLWDGTWEIAQSSKYRKQCDYLTECTGITGIINLNSKNVPDGTDEFYEVACDFGISCAIRGIRRYLINVSIPLYSKYELGFIYSFEENI